MKGEFLRLSAEGVLVSVVVILGLWAFGRLDVGAAVFGVAFGALFTLATAFRHRKRSPRTEITD